jgi:protein TonB
MSAFLFRAPPFRRLALVLVLVLAVHGALVFALLQDRTQPAPEAPAMVAFFVAPPNTSVMRPPAPVAAPKPPTPIPSPSPPRPAVAPSLAAAQPLPSQAVVPSDPPPSQSAAAAPSPASPASSSDSVTPSTAVPTAPTPPLEVSIEGVKLVRPPPRVYPTMSRRLGETGRVVVRVVIDTQGVPTEVSLAEPSRYARLNEEALRSARQARFDPYRVNGRPMSVTILWPFVFNLEDRE